MCPLYEGPDNYRATGFRGYVDCARNAVPAVHAHLPQRTIQILDVRLAHAFKAISLDQFDNPAKTGPHIGRKSFDLVPNAGVEQFNASRHPDHIIAFLQ